MQSNILQGDQCHVPNFSWTVGGNQQAIWSLLCMRARWRDLQPAHSLPGFVHPLPKRADGIFHGVCSWSLLRARECLKHLGELADQHQFGFLPGKEDSAGLLGNQHSEERCGWVTDIQKAFENIPRQPIRWNPKTNCHLSPRLFDSLLSNTVAVTRRAALCVALRWIWQTSCSTCACGLAPR